MGMIVSQKNKLFVHNNVIPLKVVLISYLTLTLDLLSTPKHLWNTFFEITFGSLKEALLSYLIMGKDKNFQTNSKFGSSALSRCNY